ncbi:alpha/beta hydrolase [Roseibium sp.]|uniref:alpha/beta hydrolase n=1 Tax=Roseibium sp. TaxID=1936156 RepID=UPI003D0FAB34
MTAEDSNNSTPPAPDGTETARKVGRTVRKVLVAGAIAYGIAAGYMYLNQRNFVFVPTGELETPGATGLENVTVESVTMQDGTNVTVWTSEGRENTPVVLYFHGNSSNLSTRHKRFAQVLDSGFGLYAPSYRGYPGSEGSPSEAAFIRDALEHFDRASATGRPVIVHGESLGTGVATAVAEQRPDAGLLVLEAPYTALVDIASAQYPWLPVSVLMKDPMPTRERIQNIQSPVLIVHGTDDRVIPVAHGERLYELAPEPKTLKIVEGVSHSGLWGNGLWDAVQDAYCTSKVATRAC